MSDAKHTPGPWRVFDNFGERICIHNADDYGIGEAWNFNGRPENIANARLIAAAPDLLAVAQILDRYCTEDFPDGPDDARRWADARGTPGDHLIEIWRATRAAIARATGQPTKAEDRS